MILSREVLPERDNNAEENQKKICLPKQICLGKQIFNPKFVYPNMLG